MEHQTKNHLANESSPYLLQHVYNPVDWYPWGDEALQKAKSENKPLIISIGYSACHWCHVMEHESFEDSSVAALMNEHFVCIKVDREERPDIDQIYMDACQLLTGSGGWPLNAIALPDGRPIYAGTYFPKENWISVLEQLHQYIEQQPQEAELRAKQITNAIQVNEMVSLNDTLLDFIDEDLHRIWQNWSTKIDLKWGGRKGAPKFMMPSNYQYLIEYGHQYDLREVDHFTELTLDKMMYGGLFDQIKGGFSRYSVDDQWHVPHFEKMLYDNAQLLSLYSKGFQKFGHTRYQSVIEMTYDWLLDEMTNKTGGFYSALDADSEGVEGKFYVWDDELFKSVIGEEDTELATEYYDVSPRGNWEHTNVLRRLIDDASFAQKQDLKVSELQEKVTDWNAMLLAERSKRVRPGLDNKILTSWNALTIIGLVDAYLALNDSKYLKTAQKNAEFLLSNLVDAESGKVLRSKDKNDKTIQGFLDDYTHTILAFEKLYEATFDEQWLFIASNILETALSNFYDADRCMFYYTDNNDLIAKKMEVSDNVIPSSNAMMATALHKIGTLKANQKYLDISRQMLVNLEDKIVQYPMYYSQWAMLMQYAVSPPLQVAILGDKAQEFRQTIAQKWAGEVIYLGDVEANNTLPLLANKYQKGQTLIYVCQDKTCQLPVDNVEEALNIMKALKPSHE